MSSNIPISDHYKIMNPDSVRFNIFTGDEVRKMSVLKITTPLTFDALGHPFKGGLYDPILGPLNDRGDPCGTCLSMSSCPGHVGHIELPVPVVNPLFHRTLHTILNISCLHCHLIQINVGARKNFKLKLKLVEAGLITDAMDVDLLIPEMENVSDEIEENEVLKKHLKTLKSQKNPPLEIFQNKNIYKIYNKFVADTLKTINNKACLFCKQPIRKITTLNNRLMQMVFVTEDNKVVKKNTSITPDISRDHMRKLWENDKEIIKFLVPVLKSITSEIPIDIFFLEVVLVPPPIVRPANKLIGQLVEHPQTQMFKNILKVGFLIRSLIQVAHDNANTEKGAANPIAEETKPLIEAIKGDTFLEKLHNTWQDLQLNIDYLITTEKSMTGGVGLKQIIEKKEGIIRCHMMGKRVNFAARSVITPDPNLDIDEIGIPEAIAMKLSYPIYVTPWNVENLRKLVINGPNKHPGATLIENEDGKVVSLPAWSKSKREGLAMRLLTPDEKKPVGMKIVRRHLMNGDVLLLNRQPTLHKPSIMAHKVRVLKGEKTLRLHYANCKAYNADFDGDEMNAHFPQNEIARSEAYNILKVNHQYLVPKDGTPLNGLIQDHVISGVRLTMRGRFFTKSDYQQLVFQGLSHLSKPIKLLPPTIIKPQFLWSGKQVLSTLIINITPDKKTPISLIGTAKINSRAWQTEQRRPWKAGGTQFFNDNTMSESEVIISHGELLAGILDKSHFGATPYGLIHSFYELYGGIASSTLLSAFSKLFTYFLQWEGFTLGVKDILVVPNADLVRTRIVKECRTIGTATASEAAQINTEVSEDEIKLHIEEALSKDPKFKAVLDRKFKTALDKYTNSINKVCLPSGLLSQFPSNNLQLMVQSGAKGSTVNTMQISCLLGQIELEGKRPPIMVSGRSLPCFPPFDTSPRAGGFVDGRFMTGIQPPEFFFHCMAGREGLIDTAVKTSKSGYLQRCLIKHLEGITIAYDMTVRDSDNSVIQFAYGEDGMDVCKAQFINEKQLKFLDLNTEAIIHRTNIETLKESTDLENISKHNRKLKKWFKKSSKFIKRLSPFHHFSNSIKSSIDSVNYEKYYDGRDPETCNLIEAWKSADKELKEDYKKKFINKCPDPLPSIMSTAHDFGVINEKLTNLIERYLESRDKLIETGYRLSSCPSEFTDMMWMKSMESLAPPGEPVGLLAAQSIGEPSTQMTLNTFHFAGRGDMNVTLGIPRLREILMMASSNLKTPTLDIPFKTEIPNFTKQAEKLQKRFYKVTVENVLHKVDVHSELNIYPNRELSYEIEFHFLPRSMYKDLSNVTPKQIMAHMENRFFNLMFNRIWKASGRKLGTMIGLGVSHTKRNNEDEQDGEAKNDEAKMSTFNDKDDSSGDEAGNDDDDNTEVRLRSRRNECQEYDDPESDEEEESDKENTIDEESKELKDEGFDEEDVKPDVHSMDVVKKYEEATNYTYDREKYLWCKLAFNLPVSLMKIDLTAIIKYAAEKSVIKEVSNIKRAIIYRNNSDEYILKTEGINMIEIFKHDNLLNLNKLYSNDVHAIARTYGIEAACKVIIKEVQNVFGVYGIKVDFRHLSLIADYMTYNGIFEPLSRKGMESSASPLQQMSFESSLTFLKEAALKGKIDFLTSASSCLMLGQPCKSGTGSFTLCNKYDETL